MLRHRHGARLVTAYAPVSPRALSMAEAGLRAMYDTGLPLPIAAYAGDTLVSYVTGFAIQEQTMPLGADHAEHGDGELRAPSGHLGGFPLLAKWTSTKPKSKDEAFATGLDLIITGIRALASRSPLPSTAANAPLADVLRRVCFVATIWTAAVKERRTWLRAVRGSQTSPGRCPGMGRGGSGRCSRDDPAGLVGPHRDLHPVADAELGHQARQVRLHRTQADVQGIGDLGVGQPPRDGKQRGRRSPLSGHESCGGIPRRTDRRDQAKADPLAFLAHGASVGCPVKCTAGLVRYGAGSARYVPDHHPRASVRPTT